MKSRLPIVLAAVLLSAGCVTHYDVVRSNGDRLTAKNKPKLIPASADNDPYWLFVDMAGRTNKIPTFQIRTIQPQDKWSTDPKNNFYLSK